MQNKTNILLMMNMLVGAACLWQLHKHDDTAFTTHITPHDGADIYILNQLHTCAPER